MILDDTENNQHGMAFSSRMSIKEHRHTTYNSNLVQVGFEYDKDNLRSLLALKCNRHFFYRAFREAYSQSYQWS